MDKEQFDAATALKRQEIRAQIDNDVVKGLLLINGGAAVALLAFLPTLFEHGKVTQIWLFVFVLFALLVYLIGLFFAVIHNHLRRRCSIEYDKPHQPGKIYQKYKDKIKWKWLEIVLMEPDVCVVSWAFMAFSACCFIVAGILVMIGGFTVLGWGAAILALLIIVVLLSIALWILRKSLFIGWDLIEK